MPFGDRTLQDIRKRMQDIGALVYSDRTPIRDVAIWETKECVSAKEAAAQKFKPCKAGRTWGGPWRTAWFRVRLKLPASLAGKNAVARIVTGGEAVAFIGGVPVCGLNVHRSDIALPKAARAGQELEILVEAGANDAFGGIGGKPALSVAELAVLNDEVQQLVYDLDFLYGAMDSFDRESARRAEILYVLAQAVKAFDLDASTPDELNATAARASRVLRPLFGHKAHDSATEVTLSGHSHIDVIWLWPLWETTRKCARTFSSMVAYMDRYPEFKFTQSQAYLYETTRKHYPKLYEKIRRAVRAGQWEVSTGMYVEADCNLTSGESLVRQVLFGKRFAREEFGLDVDVLMLPDVFGYSAALPQIMRKAGIRYFTTQKLCWNDTNEFPHYSFFWHGLDGSEVLAHFLPSWTYNAMVEPSELVTTEKRHRQKDRSKPILFQYGFGDGGGGATPRMIEFGRRARNFEGLPKCKTGFVSEFFHALERESRDLPRWMGELYLEMHRGTFTTQAKTKLLNRRCEFALRDAEFLGVIGMAAGAKYDQAKLTECWKTVLLHQFHDVLPGSSKAMVYAESTVRNAEALSAANALAERSAGAAAAQIDTAGEGEPVVVWNTLSWPRSGPVRVEPGRKGPVAVVNSEGEAVPVQKSGGGILFRAKDVPAMGYEVYRLVAAGKAAEAARLKVTQRLLENRFLRVRLNRDGEITSLYDKRLRREMLRGGKANELQLFDDRPYFCDAWEVDYHPRDERLPLPRAQSIRIVERGPVRAAVEVRRRFGKSSIVQRIVLWADEARVDFETVADWHEAHKLLKAAFPVDVHSMQATYEIQFGNVQRPTHTNTGWDAAKFEVCAHKWADLSDASGGVSLLNDCKYGHDIRGNTMRLTLLRAPKEPDETADMGRHEFAYSVMPHAGDHVDACTVRRGYEFNVPLLPARAKAKRGALPRSCSFFEVDSPAVVLDTVKKAEEDNSLIVRLYEAHGGAVRANLVSPLPIRQAVECDLLERKTPGRAMQPVDCSLSLEFRPFEIKTLKLKLE